jgi:hypothetical protein
MIWRVSAMGIQVFLLQNFSQPPDNFMMHLLVEDVDAW